MAKLGAFIIAFVVGGFGAVGQGGHMDPALATSLATVLAAGIGEWLRRQPVKP